MKKIFQKFEILANLIKKKINFFKAFSNDFDYPDYDADNDDDNWLKEKTKSLELELSNDLIYYFETIMDRLEKTTGYSTNIMSLDEAKMLLLKENNINLDDNDNNSSSSTNVFSSKSKEERESFILSVYEYWKNKRLRLVIICYFFGSAIDGDLINLFFFCL